MKKILYILWFEMCLFVYFRFVMMCDVDNCLLAGWIYLYFCIFVLLTTRFSKMMRWWWMLMLVLLACLSYCMSVFLFALYLSDLNFHSQATTVCFLSWRRTWRTSKESIVLHTVLHCKTQSSSDFNVLRCC